MNARSLTLPVRADAETLFARISPAAGKVVGVHDRSATAMLAGVPVNLQTVEDALHPLGVLVPRGFLASVRPEMPVRLVWPRIAVGPEARPLLAEARLEASIAVPSRPGPIQPEILGANLARLDRTLRLGRKPSGVNEAVFGRDTAFSEPLARLGDALEKGRVDLIDWLEQCGAGEGATPAWDDLVTGVLLADRLWPRATVIASPAFLAAAREKTTPVAAWQLQFAAMGLSSLRLERLMRGMGTRPLAIPELMRALECGHSSGSDILSGAWFCMARRIAARDAEPARLSQAACRSGVAAAAGVVAA
jgi:hypothetical protein